MTKKTQKPAKPVKRAKASKQAAPAKKSKTPKPPGKVHVLFGADEYAKPRAARFSAEDPDLLAKAAEAMHLRLVEATGEDLAEIATRLPAGRLHANGRSLVPYEGTCTRNWWGPRWATRVPSPIRTRRPKTCRGPGTTSRQAMSCWPGRAWNAAGGRPW